VVFRVKYKREPGNGAKWGGVFDEIINKNDEACEGTCSPRHASYRRAPNLMYIV
jgi:hypothetical protein